MWYLLRSLSLFFSGVWAPVFVVNEVGQSMTEIQSKQMVLCLNPLHTEFLRCWGDWKYEMSLFPAISELHRLGLSSLAHEAVPNIYYQLSVNTFYSSSHTINWK